MRRSVGRDATLRLAAKLILLFGFGFLRRLKINPHRRRPRFVAVHLIDPSIENVLAGFQGFGREHKTFPCMTTRECFLDFSIHENFCGDNFLGASTARLMIGIFLVLNFSPIQCSPQVNFKTIFAVAPKVRRACIARKIPSREKSSVQTQAKLALVER